MKMQTQETSPSVGDDPLSLAAERARRYVREIGERRVAPAPDAVAALAQFHAGLPETPSDPRDVGWMLDQLGTPATVGAAGTTYFGFWVVGGLTRGTAAHWPGGS